MSSGPNPGTGRANLISRVRSRGTDAVHRAVWREYALMRARLLLGSGLARQIRERRVWLFGGSSGRKYADNSASLHRYVREHYSDIDALWVISRSSPDLEAARKNGPVLLLEDADTFLFGLLADVHVVSHGVHDIPGCASRLSRAFKVRVGHGLTGLKPQAFGRRVGRPTLNRIFDLVPVTSHFEAENKTAWGGFPKEKLCMVGMPRLDELALLDRLADRAKLPRQILFMPTAREWLASHPSAFATSEFARNLGRFLENPRLREAMDRFDVRLSIFVHPAMWNLRAVMDSNFGSDRVRVLQPNADFQRALAGASLLITDYSSVAWDALYIDRPVLFFQPDHDQYFRQRSRGPRPEVHDELFGAVVSTPSDAADHVVHCIETGFTSCELAEHRAFWRKKAFRYVDTNNRQRIVDEIVARLRKHNG